MSFLTDRIAATQALIVKYEEAMTALASGAQSYTLDTGQSKQVVTKSDLDMMEATLKMLDSRLAVYEARSGANGPKIGRPAF